MQEARGKGKVRAASQHRSQRPVRRNNGPHGTARVTFHLPNERPPNESTSPNGMLLLSRATPPVWPRMPGISGATRAAPVAGGHDVSHVD